MVYGPMEGLSRNTYVRGDHAFYVSIIDTIIAKAQGMYVIGSSIVILISIYVNTSVRFLMAQLHLGSLAKKNNKKDVRLSLQRLPEKLDDTYADAIRRISSQDEEDVQLAKRTLMWISFAKRRLSIIELRHALAIEPGAKELDPESLPDKDVIIDVCYGLVAIDRESETMRLVHYTTQDYLVRVRAELFATAEIDMTFCCLTYVLCSTSAQISDPEESVWLSIRINVAELEAAYPFWSYAVRFWGSHAYEKAQYDARLQHLIFQLLELDNKALGLARGEPLRDKWEDFHFLRDVPGMHTAAYFDLTRLVDTLLDRGTLVDAKTNVLFLTALHCAAIGGHVTTLRLLLDRGALIDMPHHYGYTALMMAAEGGHKASVQFLLEKGADANAQDTAKLRALHIATQERYQGIAELLLDKGADVNGQNWWGQTALSKAAQEGYQEIVELLLKKGADIDGRDPHGKTALYMAAQEGYQSIVELLLEKGADVNGQDHDGRTALSKAAQEGYQSIVELLLDKSADVNGQDHDGRTALDLAALMGFRSVVELLLENGADVNARDPFGDAALPILVHLDDASMLEFLLRHGADVDARRRYDGATALHVAAMWGQKSNVQLLIDAGADLEAKASYEDRQLTASGIAKEKGHMDVFEILQKAQEQRKTPPIRNLTQSQNLVDESNSPVD